MGAGHSGNRVPYELVDGRFYAENEELLDHFPDLTASKLEECVKEAFKKEREFRGLNP